MQLIVGLGNPGTKYSNTRHNLGFMVLDRVSSCFSYDKKFQAEVARIELLGKIISCIKPQTFMNLSGQSVAAFANYYQIEPKKILVIHDDLDLDFGVIRLKINGGEGGHNGLKSISESLDTREYMRLRVGIGKPEASNKIPIEDWVLSKFRAGEKDQLENVLTKAKKSLEDIVGFGFAKAQSLLNSN